MNTHLHARYGAPTGQDQYLEVRIAQVVQICATLQAVNEPLIAMGDFNCRAGESEYRILEGLCGWTDLGVQFDATQPTAGRATSPV